MNVRVTCVLGKPAIHAQADHDGAGASDGHVSTAHPKDAVAGPNCSLVGADLRVTRDIGKGTQAQKCRGACRSASAHGLDQRRPRSEHTNDATGRAVFKLGAVLLQGLLERGRICIWLRHGCRQRST